MSQDLVEFFRQKKEKSDAESAGVNWEQKKTEWLQAIEELYAQIKSFLATPLNQGVIRLATQKKTLSEDHIGWYEIDELVLSVGDERVIFSPKGRNVFGAAGRVDVKGELGEAMLVVQPGQRWSVVKSKYPQLRLVPLNEESFEETLRSVMRQ